MQRAIVVLTIVVLPCQLNVAPPHIRESDEDEDVAAAEAVRMNKGKQKKKKENRKKFNARQSGASTERWDDDDDEIEDTPNAPAAVPKLPAGNIIKTPPREKPQGHGKRTSENEESNEQNEG